MPGDTAPSELQPFATRSILGTRVDAVTIDGAVAIALGWAAGAESRAICFATVNNVMTARADPEFAGLQNSADLITCDGMPMVWGMRLLGVPEAEQVCGPVLMPRLCAAAAAAGVPVGFYGGRPEVLGDLVKRVTSRWPALDVAYSWSPPFRTLTPEDEARVVEEIRGSGTRILFVGLGCPKQERWIARHRGRIPAVMLGVGAAFDFEAGHKPSAPDWLRRAGLEWLFRLVTEPKRLWRRYVLQNPLFLALFGAQVVRARLSPPGRRSS